MCSVLCAWAQFDNLRKESKKDKISQPENKCILEYEEIPTGLWLGGNSLLKIVALRFQHSIKRDPEPDSCVSSCILEKIFEHLLDLGL